MKFLITGGTGFVGSQLVEVLHQAGHQLVVLTRDPQRGRRMFPSQTFPQVSLVAGNIMEPGDWQNAVAGCDGVANLAGVPIAERWTPAYKQEILASRQLGTRQVVAAIAQADPRPAVLINASAVGFYGTSETATFDETSPSGDDFLAEVCRQWEGEAHNVQDTGTRLVILRFGIVLGQGGAIGRMLTPFRLFAGGPLGSGEQWFSWIHREDLVRLIQQALTDGSFSGTYNATTPNPVRMKELCATLGDVMQRPSWLPVPSFVLETLLGEGAQAVLQGQKVLPKRLQAQHFDYQYPDVRAALEAVVQD